MIAQTGTIKRSSPLLSKELTVVPADPWWSAMKMIAEYLDHARQFERLAALEENPKLKAELEKQAAAYRKLAADRTMKKDTPENPD